MIDLKDYGFTKEILIENTQWIPARITAVHKERCALICQHGETYGRLKSAIYYGSGAEDFPTTGDFVLIDYNFSGDSQIVKTLERKTFFSRRDPTPGRGEQAVASNFDYVFIMQSLNHDLNLKRLERYLTLAWQSGAIPVVVLTKADLAEDVSGQLRMVERIAAGCGVYAISAKTGYGLEDLGEYLKAGKTLVLLGSSGVGKSSFVNALAGEEIMNVKEIREDDSRGRHTTTHRQLIMLKNGLMVIDTPGMRELGMWDVSSGIIEAFTDVEEYMGRCRFSDCKHVTEPGCVIREAIENGKLSKERWDSYLKLRREARYTDRKSSSSRHKDGKDNVWSKKKRREGKNFEE